MTSFFIKSRFSLYRLAKKATAKIYHRYKLLNTHMRVDDISPHLLKLEYCPLPIKSSQKLQIVIFAKLTRKHRSQKLDSGTKWGFNTVWSSNKQMVKHGELVQIREFAKDCSNTVVQWYAGVRPPPTCAGIRPFLSGLYYHPGRKSDFF